MGVRAAWALLLFIAPSSAEKSGVTKLLLFGGGPKRRVQILGIYSVPLVRVSDLD